MTDRGLSFSVVIPTYNRQAPTERAIISCLEQDQAPLEIIVVDDHSLEPFVWSGSPSVRIIRHERNYGGGKARNTGIDAACGDLVCFLDSDDVWLPGKLAAVRRALDRSASADSLVVFHDVLISENNVRRRRYRNRPLRANEDILEYLFVRGGLAQTSTLVVPRQLAQRARFDDALRLHQDWDFCLRLQQAGGRFHLIPVPLAIWQGGEGGDRVSQTAGAERSLAWVRSLEGRVSDKVLSAINALVVAPRLCETDPEAALGYLLSAWRAGGLGTLRTLHRMRRLGFLNPAGLRLISGSLAKYAAQHRKYSSSG